MKARIALLLAALAGFLPDVVESAYGEDLGARAQTYRLDPDAREEFKDVIRRKQATGELDRFWQTYRDKTLASIRNPAPLGIKSDLRPRSEFKLVRFVVASDYRNARGDVIVRRGTVVEPLKLQPLTSGLIFIDGRDPAQLDYAIAQGLKRPLKIVLTAGSPLALRMQYQNAAWGVGTSQGGRGIPFYFDQRSIILDTLKKFYGVDIASVPTILTQEGTGLRVESGLMSMGARP